MGCLFLFYPHLKAYKLKKQALNCVFCKWAMTLVTQTGSAKKKGFAEGTWPAVMANNVSLSEYKKKVEHCLS